MVDGEKGLGATRRPVDASPAAYLSRSGRDAARPTARRAAGDSIAALAESALPHSSTAADPSSPARFLLTHFLPAP
jgi:hypothetical protein